jgi:hypothetical protein
MSINPFVVGAVGLVFLGTVAGACKRSGDNKTSATPNSDSAAGGVSPKAEFSRNLGTALCAA